MISMAQCQSRASSTSSLLETISVARTLKEATPKTWPLEMVKKAFLTAIIPWTTEMWLSFNSRVTDVETHLCQLTSSKMSKTSSSKLVRLVVQNHACCLLLERTPTFRKQVWQQLTFMGALQWLKDRALSILEIEETGKRRIKHKTSQVPSQTLLKELQKRQDISTLWCLTINTPEDSMLRTPLTAMRRELFWELSTINTKTQALWIHQLWEDSTTSEEILVQVEKITWISTLITQVSNLKWIHRQSTLSMPLVLKN